VVTWAAAALFVVFPIVVEALGGDRGIFGYYGASAIFLAIFISLVTRNQLDGGRWDRFLGDLAYPVLLTHFFSAGVVNLLTSNRFMVTSTINMALSTAMCLAISVAFLQWVEPQIEKMRNRIRGRAAWAK
jgi:peptidoglycan/LPS O-acetylase OafA/YrhL